MIQLYIETYIILLTNVTPIHLIKKESQGNSTLATLPRSSFTLHFIRVKVSSIIFIHKLLSFCSCSCPLLSPMQKSAMVIYLVNYSTE